jgi:MFS family permease
MRGRGSGFGEVLGIREFRALWAAELLSVLGDQLARIALALLVFDQTSSAALTALTYALTFVPAVLGGLLLSGLADRYPRRRVLIATDVLRAILAGAMAIPVLPLPVLWVLVGALSMAAGPFKAAQLALLPQILTGERYVVGLSLRQVTGQSAQLVGFASGGLLLAAVEPHLVLGLNAATFLISAALIAHSVRPRPAPNPGAPWAPGETRPVLAGNRALLPAITLVCLAGLFVVPEGIAAPYGAALGVGSLGVGLLMAADPLGSVIGAWLLARLRIPATRTAAVLLAAGAGVPLVLCVLGPGLEISIALWGLSGVFSTTYLIVVQAIVVDLVPDHRRGRVLGRISTYLYTSQGLAILAGGFAAETTGPFRAVAEAGLLGIVLVLCVGGWWRRVARSRRDLAAGSEQSLEARDRGSHVLGRHDVRLLSDGSKQNFADGAGRSHVLGRHDGHLLSGKIERGFDNRNSTSHVLGRHAEHLPSEKIERGFDKRNRTSHVLGRHGAHLPPHRTQQPSVDRNFWSHVLGRHGGHLPPGRTQRNRDYGNGHSHVLGRHDGHLPPNRLARTISVTASNALSLVRGLSSGMRALSLWVLSGHTLGNRIVARRTARA